ncbi:MAG: HNH endonuclease [bacterium]
MIAKQGGIWKPTGFETPLSILTTYAARPDQRPYDDRIGDDEYPRYKWQGTDPGAYDNVALRKAMELQTPLIWFWAVAPGLFDPMFPIWVVGEEPAEHQFVVALDETLREHWVPTLGDRTPFDPVRRYASVTVKQRLHQRLFRHRVLLAYGSACALCRLRHVELLDAAHIKEDSEGGQPIVPNGVSMCVLHHKAFDKYVLRIGPDYRVEVRRDVLEEADGPTLQHALQGLHGNVLALPSRRNERPSADLLEERYERFRSAV